VKIILCPHCQKEIKIRTKMGITVDTGEVKETTPQEVLSELKGLYLSIKGVNRPLTGAEHGRLGKAFKQLLSMCNGDIGLAKSKVSEADDYFGELSWTLETLLKTEHFDKIGKKNNSYEGW